MSTLRRSLATLALTFTVSWPSLARADHVVVGESGGETVTFVNRRLLTTGTILFLGGYVPSVVVGAESSRPSDNPSLFIPVAGPWIDIGERDCGGPHPCAGESGSVALLVADGVVQGLGALAILSSFVIHERRGRNWIIIGNDKVQAAPTTFGRGSAGFAAMGTF
jgi:hypothetical protein